MADALAACDDWRRGQSRQPLSAIDGADKYRPKLHLDGENAAVVVRPSDDVRAQLRAREEQAVYSRERRAADVSEHGSDPRTMLYGYRVGPVHAGTFETRKFKKRGADTTNVRELRYMVAGVLREQAAVQLRFGRGGGAGLEHVADLRPEDEEGAHD